MTTVQTLPAGEDARFVDHYLEWREARINAIRWHYGDAFFAGKTLLELGCGYGDIGAGFACLGARVTCSDARDEHLARVRARWPLVRTVRADLDCEWPFEAFDIILHLGTLYHLEPGHHSLRRACSSCSDLVVETEVCDSSDPQLVITTDERGYDQAFGGVGCRPSGARIEQLLAEEGMAFERVNDSRCNSGIHVYDWPVKDTGEFADGLRRFWFATKATRS